MSNFSVISSDRSPSYMFMAPIVSMLWPKVGYNPLLIFTETNQVWLDDLAARCVLTHLPFVNPRWIGPITGPYRTSVQAQASRQHAACCPDLNENDYLMTADIDMLPLSFAWFNKQDWSKDVHIWWASAWDWRWFTTPYIGMKVSVWREIMGMKAGYNINGYLQAAFDKHLTPKRDTYQEWFFDETHFNSRFKNWDGYPDRVQFMDREGHPPKDRIDRAAWPENPSLTGMVDAHVPRPSYTGEGWRQIRKLLVLLLTKDEMDYIDAYQKEFEAVAK